MWINVKSPKSFKHFIHPFIIYITNVLSFISQGQAIKSKARPSPAAYKIWGPGRKKKQTLSSRIRIQITSYHLWPKQYDRNSFWALKTNTFDDPLLFNSDNNSQVIPKLMSWWIASSNLMVHVRRVLNV